MQISVLKKLLHQISPKISLKDRKRSAETLESRTEDKEVQSAECKVQSAKCKVQSAECKVQSYRGEDCSSECKTPSDDDATEAAAEVVKSETKAHLTSSVPRSARAPIGVLTKSEIGELRNIFANLSDTEIQKLYKRVTKQN